MCNFLFLNDKSLPRAEDQDEVKVSVKGIFEEVDGERTLKITEVDGFPVVEMDHEEDSPCGNHEDEMSMDSEDALMLFIQKPKKLK